MDSFQTEEEYDGQQDSSQTYMVGFFATKRHADECLPPLVSILGMISFLKNPIKNLKRLLLSGFKLILLLRKLYQCIDFGR